MTKEVYQKSVDILLDAYNSRTLFHGSCYACAVGNLIAANNSIKIVNDEWDEGFPYWDSVFVTDNLGQHYSPKLFTGKAKEQIESTGISLEELMKIEYTFESVDEEGQFLGLCAVLDVMKDMVGEEVPYQENQSKLELIHQNLNK